MAVATLVYQVYIKAPASLVWDALSNPEFTQRYFHGTAFAEPPQAGRGFRTVIVGTDNDAIEGAVKEFTPPSETSAGRFVHTWHILYDAELSAEAPGTVEWTVEPLGPELTRLKVVHGDLSHSPKTWTQVEDGWVWILDALKTLLETGTDLPAPPVDDVPIEATNFVVRRCITRYKPSS